RLGLAQTTPGAAQLSRANGRLELSAGNPDGERASVLVHGDGVRTDLRRQEASLAGVNAMIVGHTRFQLAPAGDTTKMPLSAFRLDAYGNVVVRIDYAGGAPRTGVDGNGSSATFTLPAAQAALIEAVPPAT
ncbi:hypothetical protein, partial [Pseudomonas viridiflava]|uniref:hypothetical protein n=1 Tax=Pseudomonas viridiflava TaxID=33069 RepID=UPI0019D163BD